MANPQGLPVLVDVFAHPPGSSDPYTIDWRFQGGPSQGNTPIDLPRGSGSHDMIFTLHDDSGKGLKFKSAAEEAMWISSGNGCPTGKGSGANQIQFGSVSQPDRMVLRVNDKNSGNRRNLHYMLRFDPDPNVFDPEIRNGGGTNFNTSAMITTAGGAALGAVASLLLSPAATIQSLALWVAAGAVAGYVVGLVLGGGRSASPA